MSNDLRIGIGIATFPSMLYRLLVRNLYLYILRIYKLNHIGFPIFIKIICACKRNYFESCLLRICSLYRQKKKAFQ